MDRPLDSHAPQTEHIYTYDDDDWGETEEDNSQVQWAAGEWEASDQVEQHESYVYQNEDNLGEPQDQEETAHESDEFDEDDQDNYE